MNIDWKRIKTFIKFHLGMKCVVQYGDKYVVTKLDFIIGRLVLDTFHRKGEGGYFWPEMYKEQWSLFKTEEDAIKALENHCQILSKPRTKFKV